MLTTTQVDDVEIFISASFGISVYPKDGTTASELLKYSDMAMYHAKTLGKNMIQKFNLFRLNDSKTQARYTALVQRACFMMNNILNSVKILNMIIQKVLNCK